MWERLIYSLKKDFVYSSVGHLYYLSAAGSNFWKLVSARIYIANMPHCHWTVVICMAHKACKKAISVNCKAKNQSRFSIWKTRFFFKHKVVLSFKQNSTHICLSHGTVYHYMSNCTSVWQIFDMPVLCLSISLWDVWYAVCLLKFFCVSICQSVSQSNIWSHVPISVLLFLNLSYLYIMDYRLL